MRKLLIAFNAIVRDGTEWDPKKSHAGLNTVAHPAARPKIGLARFWGAQ
jgi:hypothetical protein